GARERSARRQPVHQAEELVAVAHGIGVKGVHERASVALDRDPAFALEGDEPFADGNAAERQGLGHVVLRHALAGLELAVEDEPADVLSRLLPAAAAAGRRGRRRERTARHGDNAAMATSRRRRWSTLPFGARPMVSTGTICLGVL